MKTKIVRSRYEVENGVPVIQVVYEEADSATGLVRPLSVETIALDASSPVKGAHDALSQSIIVECEARISRRAADALLRKQQEDKRLAEAAAAALAALAAQAAEKEAATKGGSK